MKIVFSPHVLSVNEDGFFTITFKNAGPSKVNHVVATAAQANGDPMPIPSSAYIQPLPTGCVILGTTTTKVQCDIGQVAPGSVTRQIRFNATLVTSFVPGVSATFDESKGSQLTDTVTDTDFPFFMVSGDDQTKKGQCDETPQLLIAFDAAQQTDITAPNVTPLFGCTPVSAGVDATHQPKNVSKHFGEISFVDFLGSALAVVNVIFENPPAGVTKANIEIYELSKFTPAGGDDALTATNNGLPVPDCDSNGQITKQALADGYVSCVARTYNAGGGAIGVEVHSKGNDDGGWGGIG